MSCLYREYYEGITQCSLAFTVVFSFCWYKWWTNRHSWARHVVVRYVDSPTVIILLLQVGSKVLVPQVHFTIAVLVISPPPPLKDNLITRSCHCMQIYLQYLSFLFLDMFQGSADRHYIVCILKPYTF